MTRKHGARGRMVFCLVATAAWSVLLVPAAWADCSLLDPICTVEDTTGTVVETVEDTTGTVVDTVEDTTGTVVETVEDTTGTVVETVEPTEGSVEEVLQGTTGGVGGSVPGPPTVVPGTDTTVQPPPGTDGGTPPGPDGPATGTGSAILEPGAIASATAGTGGSATSAPTTPATSVGRSGPSDAIGRLLGPVPPIAAVGFPLMLLAIVVLFLAVQGRIDRRDPKLALAPVGSEFVEFV